jgi:hypothetical protein
MVKATENRKVPADQSLPAIFALQRVTKVSGISDLKHRLAQYEYHEG